MRKAKTVVSLGGLHCLSLLPCFTTRTFLPSQHYNAFFLPLQYHVCRLSCSCHRLVVPWAAFRLQELKSSRRLSLLPSCLFYLVTSQMSLHSCHYSVASSNHYSSIMSFILSTMFLSRADSHVSIRFAGIWSLFSIFSIPYLLFSSSS